MARARKPETPDPFKEAVKRFLGAIELCTDLRDKDPEVHEIRTRVACKDMQGQFAHLCDMVGFDTKYASNIDEDRNTEEEEEDV